MVDATEKCSASQKAVGIWETKELATQREILKCFNYSLLLFKHRAT